MLTLTEGLAVGALLVGLLVLSAGPLALLLAFGGSAMFRGGSQETMELEGDTGDNNNNVDAEGVSPTLGIQSGQGVWVGAEGQSVGREDEKDRRG